MPSRDSVNANRAKHEDRLRRLILTDVDLDNVTLLVIPHPVAVATLGTFATLLHARTFEDVRRNEGSRHLVDDWMSNYLARHGYEVEGVSEGDPFDADEFFGDENWSVWKPVARLLTHDFLQQNAPDLAARYCRPDAAWGMDYEPAPWVHADDRVALEGDLAARAYEVRQWQGLSDFYLAPPLDVAERLRPTT